MAFLIGPADNPTTFLMHKEFAWDASDVFEKAFNSDFAEGRTQTYEIDDTTPRAFRFVTQWIYQRVLKTYHDQSKDLKDAMQGMVPPYYKTDLAVGRHPLKAEAMALVETWILAGKLMIPKLQNEIMGELDYMLETTAIEVTSCCLNYLYKNTGGDGLLRRFFAKAWAFEITQGKIHSAMFTENVKDFPPQMLIDVIAWQCKHHKEDVKLSRASAFHNYLVSEKEEI